MHEGHRNRVRKRFLETGLDGFEPHQVLELMLFYAIPRKDTNPLAHSLIKKYGSLAAVFEADPHELALTEGMSKNSAVLLSIIPSIARKYFKDKTGDRPIISNTSKAGEYAMNLFVGRNYEFFYIICLDAQNRVNQASLINEGTINQTVVYPRLIVEAALRHKANSVILAHNHPGGDPTPSHMDVKCTQQIVDALGAISIKVADHIIVAGDRYLSFAEEGYMT